MHFSREEALGLHVLHYLARKEAPGSTPEIARSARVGVAQTARALRRLRRLGLVRAARGRGFQLARAPGSVNLLDVLDEFRGAAPASGCRWRYDACVFRGSCPFMPLCRESYEAERAALRSMTLADLLPRAPAMPDCVGARKRAAL
jgi:Rrf2 family protein